MIVVNVRREQVSERLLLSLGSFLEQLRRKRKPSSQRRRLAAGLVFESRPARLLNLFKNRICSA